MGVSGPFEEPFDGKDYCKMNAQNDGDVGEEAPDGEEVEAEAEHPGHDLEQEAHVNERRVGHSHLVTQKN